jgi:hypothetical protein
MFSELLKLIPLFILSCFKFAFGVPAAYIFFGFNFWESFLFSFLAGFTGVFVSIYLSRLIFSFWFKIKDLVVRKKEPVIQKPIEVKKRFSKRTRLFVRIIRKYGLAGLAFITPALISIPVGSLLATKIYGKSPKVLIYMTLSVIFWSFTFSFTLSLF